eukprot:scaffold277579_cov12-Tisochrysis_lutea.AAC.1
MQGCQEQQVPQIPVVVPPPPASPRGAAAMQSTCQGATNFVALAHSPPSKSKMGSSVASMRAHALPSPPSVGHRSTRTRHRDVTGAVLAAPEPTAGK